MDEWMGVLVKGKVEDCWFELGCQRIQKVGQDGPEIAAQKRAATWTNEQSGKIVLTGEATRRQCGLAARWSANQLAATTKNSTSREPRTDLFRETSGRREAWRSTRGPLGQGLWVQ
jgi:hypothetical protein